MTAQHSKCRPQDMTGLLAGTLPQQRQRELEEHLGRCRRCAQALQQQSATADFWNDTRAFLTGGDGTCARSIEGPLSDALLPDALLPGASDRSGDPSATRPHVGTTALIGTTALGFLDPTDDPQMLGRFAGYEISGVIGRGGMGIVIKGWDRSLNRFVAIKLLDPSFAEHSASRKRFQREAQNAAAVVHDNVIAIYGVDQWKGMPFLVMPYVKGQSLQQRIDSEAPLLIEDILRIGLQIARGLAAAHDQGLVHRDVKPANILMPERVSRVIITDFGLARAADDASLTRSGVLAGTPQFMAPEQARGEAVDGRTDLFSLGSVMYAMACGRPPFRSETPYAVLRKITDEPHRPLQQVCETAPKWFAEIVDRCLQKSPEDRFASAHQLADHLEDCLSHLMQPATKVLPVLSPPRPTRRSLRRASTVAGLAILAVSLLLAFVFSDAGLVPNTLQPQRPSRDHGAAATVSQSASSAVRPEWEFDDSQLTRLEHELESLMRDTTLEPAVSPSRTTGVGND